MGFYILRSPNQPHVLYNHLGACFHVVTPVPQSPCSPIHMRRNNIPHFLVVRHLLIRGRRGPVASFTSPLQLQVHVMVHRLYIVTNIGNVGSLDHHICVLGVQQAVRSTVKPFIGMDSKHSLTSWRSDTKMSWWQVHIYSGVPGGFPTLYAWRRRLLLE